RSGDADALGAFATDSTHPERLRVEALALLSLWSKPPARDRITGLYRPLPSRTVDPARGVVTKALSKLLKPDAPPVAAAALEAAIALDAKESGSAIFEFIRAAAAPAVAR